MNKLSKSLALAAVLGVVAYATGAAAGLESVSNTLANLFAEVRSVFYVLAAFGLIGLAAAALLGKIQWKWLFALVFGVAIVAAADFIVTYAAGISTGSTGIENTSLDN